MIHLSARALEFLRGNRMPEGGYVSAVGTAACGAAQPEVIPVRGARLVFNGLIDDLPTYGWQLWCSVADVKAMVRLTRHAYSTQSDGSGTRVREVRHPTCDLCKVILDKALGECPEDPFRPLIGCLGLYIWAHRWEFNRDRWAVTQAASRWLASVNLEPGVSFSTPRASGDWRRDR